MKNSLRCTLSALVAIPMIVGCTSYYKVADPSTGKVYYTTEYDQNSSGLHLTDAKTGSKVSIINSEISQITREEFDTARIQK